MTECLVQKYRLEKRYSCAMTILHTCKDMWNMDITPQTTKVIDSWCNVYMRDDMCGAYSSCLALMHILFTSPVLAEYVDYAPALTGALYDTFQTRFGSRRCSGIRQAKMVLGDDVGCLNVLKMSAEVMQELFDNLECRELMCMQI